MKSARIKILLVVYVFVLAVIIFVEIVQELECFIAEVLHKLASIL